MYKTTDNLRLDFSKMTLEERIADRKEMEKRQKTCECLAMEIVPEVDLEIILYCCPYCRKYKREYRSDGNRKTKNNIQQVSEGESEGPAIQTEKKLRQPRGKRKSSTGEAGQVLQSPS